MSAVNLDGIVTVETGGPRRRHVGTGLIKIVPRTANEIMTMLDNQSYDNSIQKKYPISQNFLNKLFFFVQEYRIKRYEVSDEEREKLFNMITEGLSKETGFTK
jgi:hypothetical protein